MTPVGHLIGLNLTISVLYRKIRLLALTELFMVPTDVLVVWVRSSSLMLLELAWKEVLFLIVLLKVEQSLSPDPLTSTTMEGSFDLQTHFAR